MWFTNRNGPSIINFDPHILEHTSFDLSKSKLPEVLSLLSFWSGQQNLFTLKIVSSLGRYKELTEVLLDLCEMLGRRKEHKKVPASRACASSSRCVFARRK